MKNNKQVRFQWKICRGLASLLVVGSLFATAGCGGANSGEGTATDIEEMRQFLEENPELKESEPETSDLNSNEFEGITITREKV